MTAHLGPAGEGAARVEIPGQLLERARTATRVCILSGAGMSAESGIPTFRDVQVGLWERFDPMELATPEAWRADPEQAWAWYAWRASLVSGAQPNAGHLALARWQQRDGVELTIVTQNVDDLHERAGAQVLAHLHGSLYALRCSECEAPSGAAYPQVDEPVAHLDPPACEECGGAVRPGVVWFGEALPEGAFYDAVEAAQQAELVLVVGTSGLVHPAATLPYLAAAAGAHVVEINPHESEVSETAHEVWRATAARALPALVDALG